MNKDHILTIAKLLIRCGRKTHQPLIAIGFSVFLWQAQFAYANPFATSTDLDSPAMCPIGHKMYYLGARPPTFSPIKTQALSWPEGIFSNSFTFLEPTGNKTLSIRFTNLSNLNNTSGITPYYRDVGPVAPEAIHMEHVSRRVETNHILNVKTDYPISKMGYKIQDLDSTLSAGVVPYIEQVDVSANGGRLTFNDIFHTINASRDVVTAISRRNCGLPSGSRNECTIDATWGYNSVNTNITLEHNNTFTRRNSYHAIAYSDFYFCLAPPKLIVKKELNGTRINDTDSKRDQFEITVTDGSIAANSFTTVGSGAVVNNNSSTVLSLAENTRYTITERVMNGAALGEIANYNASYSCTNATTNSTSMMPTAAMSYDAANKTRSFTLADVTYGDEIICTITNTPSFYTFSGTVFNDNGGIDDSQADAHNAIIDSGLYDNANYFNGRFDTSSNPLSNPPYELGIAGSTVKLVDCASPTTVYATQNTAATGNNIGKYEIKVPLSALGGNTNLCLIEESSNNSYSLRTTNRQKVLSFNPSTYSYDNNDFGRVVKANAAVVLKKRQYVHSCSLPLTYSSINDSNDPNTGFSINPISNIKPEQCIAYKITAINRANVDVDNFIMQDTLQKKGDDNNSVVTSVLALPAREDGIYNDGLNTNDNGIIKTIARTLDKRSDFTFYFNTKYGTTNSEP